MSKKKILIVEDDSSLCILLEKLFEVSYDVTALNSSIDAWQWLSDGNYPQLIITDFKMPMIDGLELIENIRTSGIFKEIPIFILSGNDDPRLKEKCEKWGVRAFFTKPFSPENLIQTTDETLKSLNHA